MRHYLIAALTSTALVSPAFAASPQEVAQTYVELAAAGYGDSLTTAQALQTAVDAFLKAPSEETHAAAKTAWLAARVPYQQTEAFRFGNPIVDDWEGRVNAWPLDEGLIDYVDASYDHSQENPLSTLNIVANASFTLSGAQVDATNLTPDFISGTLHEVDGIEANVASGYHAIEFLLWGQDLNGTGPGAGARSHTDYLQDSGCTNGNCDRRAAYLKAATDLLVTDLAYMAGQWAMGGEARSTITADPNAALSAMLTGMGSLSYGELAGERMRLGVMLNDPEEEHDCFSDNTHNSHYYDGVGIRNVYLGSYTRVDGSVVSGPSLSALVASADPAVDAQLKAELDASVAALGAVKAAAESGMAYDQMLAAGNAEGEALIMGAVAALVTQTASINRAVTVIGASGVAIEGSDSLDNPGAVFQ
ncbi:imelysin. Metallo peptidase. MEROPS family M75 [Pseudorhodobacter antarcticus]|uniref:Imelysin. Metallo peptidase. MEROPS family M75 n=1 Tax=Pseudorhodobacter antarcticus TaxID=1077947 RepID=A0A1H8M816_9RHOB|nr:imelysin family protein [Pseudorhodobacter antarcticus]SEO13527.1 imelysin. Metallo peptidase. MEROPS family M75 [Pseudorhodobacter antarcticus]